MNLSSSEYCENHRNHCTAVLFKTLSQIAIKLNGKDLRAGLPIGILKLSKYMPLSDILSHAAAKLRLSRFHYCLVLMTPGLG